MKKLLMIFLGLSSIIFSAKLNYTNAKTTKYKGDIAKYASYKQQGYPIVSLLYDSLTGMSNPDYWKRDLGFDVADLKLFRAGDPATERKMYSQYVDHVIAMFVSFDTEMGGNYVKNNLDSIALMSTILPSNIPSGIVTISAYSPAGSTGFMTSGSVYFGDVVNELAGGYHQSSRLTGVTSNNNNLWISPFGNDDSIEYKNDMGGDNVSSAAPSQESFYFPMFGEEVQKLSRSDSIRVKDFVCNGKSNPMKTLRDVRGLDLGRATFQVVLARTMMGTMTPTTPSMLYTQEHIQSWAMGKCSLQEKLVQAHPLLLRVFQPLQGRL